MFTLAACWERERRAARTCATPRRDLMTRDTHSRWAFFVLFEFATFDGLKHILRHWCWIENDFLKLNFLKVTWSLKLAAKCDFNITSFKMPRRPQTKWYRKKTPVSVTVFNTLSHGVVSFVASGSSKNHLLTGWDFLTANQKLLFNGFWSYHSQQNVTHNV